MKNYNLTEEQMLEMISEKTKNMSDKDMSLLELKVTSKFVLDKELEKLGFLSCVQIILDKPFFSWSEDYNEQLDKMVKNYKGLFYVSSPVWETNEQETQLVRLKSEKFLQINPSHIISCGNVNPLSAVSEDSKSGGAILNFEDVESRGIKKFPYNLKAITLIDGRKINVVILGGE